MSRFPIKRTSYALTIDIIADDNQIISPAIAFNGELAGIIVTAPDLDNSDTYTLTIKDVDGNTIYTKAALVEASTTTIFIDANNFPLQLPLAKAHTITILTSGAQASDRDFTVVLLVKV